MKTIINTRADLDAITGTPEHAEFIARLKGALTTRTDVREYPPGYDRTLKEGDQGHLAPILGVAEDNRAASAFGFTRAELLAL